MYPELIPKKTFKLRFSPEELRPEVPLHAYAEALTRGWNVRGVHIEEGHILVFVDGIKMQDEYARMVRILSKAARTHLRSEREKADPPPASGFPRVWELFPFILPHSVRDRVYGPYHEELKEDYLLVRKRFRTPWAKRWITFCFTVRTAGVVAQCLWVAAGGKLRKVIVAGLVYAAGREGYDALRGWAAVLLGRLW